MTAIADETDIFEKYPMPPCARTLGWSLLARDAARGWVKLSFEARAEFCNGTGGVQGGFLAAMLDDTMGPAVIVASHGAFYAATIDMNVSFLKPAKAGRLFAEGRVVQLGKTVAFVEAQISDADGALLARATSSMRLLPMERFPLPAAAA
ncbi:MAG TPA: PaaI family thioesterase [Rhizomicrobium sp.]|jgi:uncharacterized protein (TIGR00369 family)|nr:PaaI family thioesterase [Rhizomicrobium sp.]